MGRLRLEDGRTGQNIYHGHVTFFICHLGPQAFAGNKVFAGHKAFADHIWQTSHHNLFDPKMTNEKCQMTNDKSFLVPRWQMINRS